MAGGLALPLLPLETRNGDVLELLEDACLLEVIVLWRERRKRLGRRAIEVLVDRVLRHHDLWCDRQRWSGDTLVDRGGHGEHVLRPVLDEQRAFADPVRIGAQLFEPGWGGNYAASQGASVATSFADRAPCAQC